MTALENRKRKARALARALYRRGMTLDDLRWMLDPKHLPYTSKTRGIATVTGFARAAYAEAGVTENLPHGPNSETWTLTAQLLDWMRAHPNDKRVPVQDLADDRARWVPAPAAPEPPVVPSFPRSDGATCACGAWHRRYGPAGHGALCDTCRALARGVSS